MIDIFLLLILHTTSRKKSVESLVRNKIRSGGITEALLQDVFSNHYEVRNEIMRMKMCKHIIVKNKSRLVHLYVDM